MFDREAFLNDLRAVQDWTQQIEACVAAGLVVRRDQEFDNLVLIGYGKDGPLAGEEHQSVTPEGLAKHQPRGIVVDTNTNRVVCCGIGRFGDREAFLTDLPNLSTEHAKIEEALDGVLVKLFHYQGEWRVATNRCPNGRFARWSSLRSFHDLFVDAGANSGLDYDTLDTAKTYSFVLQHPESRIVTPIQVPRIIHVCTTINDTLVETDDDIGVAGPKRAHTTLATLVDDADASSWEQQGFVVRADGKLYKITGQAYEKVRHLRGEQRDPLERLFWLRQHQPGRAVEFLAVYPEYHWVEGMLQTITRDIHQSYMDYFVRGNKRFIPNREYWNVLTRLHTLYLQTNARTTTQLVRVQLDALDARALTNLVRYRLYLPQF